MEKGISELVEHSNVTNFIQSISLRMGLLKCSSRALHQPVLTEIHMNQFAARMAGALVECCRNT